MLVITLTAGSKSLVERIPEEHTRINMDPDFYRDVDFTLDSRMTLERYRDHFIYGYLEDLYRGGTLPTTFLTATSLQVTVKRIS